MSDNIEAWRDRIASAVPGCSEISVTATNCEGRKYAVTIVSEGFRGVPLVQRHRIVNEIFADELKSGEIHALEISAKLPPQN